MIKWISGTEKNVILFSPKIIQDLNIKFEKITLHIGAWKQCLKVGIREDIGENSVGLSNNPGRPFTIPDVPYDMYAEGDNLYVGPVIAVVVRKGKLSQNRLGFWTDYCRNYADIRGLIYFCMVDGIDMNTKTIRGYYYDPNAQETEQWKSGVFPYPGVVYQRTRIPKDTLQDLMKHTDGKVFNAHLFNKWEMWEVLSEAGFTHTPNTVMLNGVDSLEQMLNLYDSVYLKPVRGRFGIGIQKVEKQPNGYLLKDDTGREERAADPFELFQLSEKYRKKRKYIVQQGVPLIYENKPVDFRVILQKDGSQEWTCSGIIAKLGYVGRIYTNTPSAMYTLSEALQMIFGLTSEQALEIKDEIEGEIIIVCKEACQVMERAYGILADVGIDVTIDMDLNIWILEMNKIHQHTMVKYLQKDPDMCHRVITKPLAYAKALAGFK